MTSEYTSYGGHFLRGNGPLATSMVPRGLKQNGKRLGDKFRRSNLEETGEQDQDQPNEDEGH